MKITIDTETDTLENLQETFSILIKTIQEKGGKIVLQKESNGKKPNTENSYVKRAQEQEKLMDSIDISNILQSDHGINKKRQDSMRKNL
ncbi:MAG: hypothetical protein QGF74_03505 [Candidatus Nanoarchaeia archaeon]|jgi:hypothetical protein|nr:hypothetical protein [Candidatus Nanoarchaeia archaeon]|tara:strand:- start:41578 stop:41844 length:267 start_codon:yes stop_codon:yes gene_type:complete